VRRPPIRIRTFILGTMLALLLMPTLAAGVAWLIARDHQQAGIQHRLNTAFAYVTSHRTEMRDPASVQGFTRLLGRLELLAQLVIATTTPPGKSQLYVSPALNPAVQKEEAGPRKAGRPDRTPATSPADTTKTWTDERQRLIPVGTSTRATLAADLFYRPASRATRALVALVSGSSSCLPGSRSRSGSPAAGWSRRSPG
jgi:hypothetical protein